MKFELISETEASMIIDDFCEGRNSRIGKFLSIDDTGECTAIDNSTGDCWTESFRHPWVAVQYLINDELDAETAYMLDAI